MPRKNNYLRQIISLCRDDFVIFPLIIFLFIVQSLIEVIGLGLVAPYISLVLQSEKTEFFETFFDYIGIGYAGDDLLILSGSVLVAAFTLKFMIAYLVNRKVINFTQEKRAKLVIKLMKNYQRMPYQLYTVRNSAEYKYRIQSLTYQFTEQVLAPILRIFGDGLIAITLLVFLFIFNPTAFIVLAILLVSVVGSFDYFTKSIAKRNGILGNQYSTDMLKFATEGISGLKDIRILGVENYFLENVQKRAINFSKTSAKIQLIGVLPKYLLELVLIVFIVAMTLFGALAGSDNSDLISTLGVFGVASIRLLPIVNTLSTSFVGLRYARDSVSLLYNDTSLITLNQTYDISCDVNEPPTNSEFQTLNLENITHSYGANLSNSLTNVSLKISKGQAIGLIGPSGAGKSTLVDLLLGLLQPSAGRLVVNSKHITSDKEIRFWQKRIAYLPQKIFLIDDSIKRNVALGISDSEINEKKVEKSLDKAQLLELVRGFPMGLETKVGESGVRMSGGQAQRIALARAFYHERDILVMDESTSALDQSTEAEILNQIMSLKGEKTLIIIAHRLTTLEQCDIIYEIDNGRITTSGSYDTVIKART